MQTRTIFIGEGAASPAVDAHLSFKPFIEHLEKIASRPSVRGRQSQLLLKHLDEYPELRGILCVDDMAKYQDLFELIFMHVSDITSDENSTPWAMGMSVLPLFFYSTDTFYQLMAGENENGRTEMHGHVIEQPGKHSLEIIYTLLLERFYNLTPAPTTGMVKTYIEAETDLPRHYAINIDTRFIEITAKEPLPSLQFDTVRSSFRGGDWVKLIERKLPLHNFVFTGINMVSLTDKTSSYAAEDIKNVAVQNNIHNEKDAFPKVVKSLQTLISSKEIDFELAPLLKVNGKLVLYNVGSMCTATSDYESMQHVNEEDYLRQLEVYAVNPKILFFKSISPEEAKRFFFLPVLQKAGVQAMAIVPLYYNNCLVGTLKVFSSKPGMLTEKTMAALNGVLGHLGELMQSCIDNFDTRLDNIIKDNFTSLQPAVQWKFNDAAWHYLQRKAAGKRMRTEDISFKNVYPLYGAIDIRDSTVKRNEAAIRDQQNQLKMLLKTLNATKQVYPASAELSKQTGNWLTATAQPLTTPAELQLNNFLENTSLQSLQRLRIEWPETASSVNRYLEATGENGVCSRNRTRFDEAMQMVNHVVNTHLNQMKDEMQELYPCYFEKFRTDGVEFDIYTGQSIAPAMQFEPQHLAAFRLKQLSCLAAITKITGQLVPRLPVPLHTTQLIFLNNGTIDISFRHDERKFDVEGAYNIRYQLIKKRIDKVHVLGTGERLTQPGKIAVIYFADKDAGEYYTHIEQLQATNILRPDIEYLLLEELQGVTGLKAMRVEVLGEA